MSLLIDFNAIFLAVKNLLAADIASSDSGSLGDLGVTVIVSYGEVPTDLSGIPVPAALPSLSILPYWRDIARRRNTTGGLIGVDGIQVNVDAKTIHARGQITGRVVALLQGLQVVVSDGGQPYPPGLEATAVVPFDNEATITGLAYHRNAIRFEQHEFRQR